MSKPCSCSFRVLTFRISQVMAANGFRSPHTWKGYREISCDSFDILPFEDLMHEDDLFR